jgi:hypothetical protein
VLGFSYPIGTDRPLVDPARNPVIGRSPLYRTVAPGRPGSGA